MKNSMKRRRKKVAWLLSTEVARISRTVPKTKRMRKKNHWLYCIDCKKWFHRYTPGGKGTTVEGKRVCGGCLHVRMVRAGLLK